MGEKNRQTKKPDKSDKDEQKVQCTCLDGGGFEEHLPMHEWKRVMKSVERCAIHGSKS